MVYVYPKIVVALLKFGFKKLLESAEYKASFTGSFTVIESVVDRFKAEAATYGIDVQNFIEMDTEIDTWIENYAMKILIGYPRIHEVTEQVTVSYGVDRDNQDIMADYAGDIITEPTPGVFRQSYRLAQVEARTVDINIVSESSDIVWIMSEAVKYIMRTNRKVLEGFGIHNFTLSAEPISMPDTKTGMCIYQRTVSMAATVASTYTVPADIGGDNIAPNETLISPEPKEFYDNGFIKLGEENP